MLPQEFETIGAEEVRASEQDVQPYFEHLLWSEFCFETCVEEAYMDVIEKNLFAVSVIERSLCFLNRK